MATWKWARTPYTDRHYQRMADLAMQQGQVKANMQQNIWNTIGSTIMDLPRNIQQAKYYETLQHRQQQALEKEQKARNRELAFTAGSEQFVQPDGRVDYDAWEQDLLNIDSFEGPRREDSYVNHLTGEGSRATLLTDLRGAARNEIAEQFQDMGRVNQARTGFSKEMAIVANDLMDSGIKEEKRWASWQERTGPESDLMKRARILDRLTGGTQYSEGLTTLSSVPYDTFYGMEPDSEGPLGRPPRLPKDGDSWAYLYNSANEAARRAGELGFKTQVDQETERAFKLGVPLNQPFRSMSFEQQDRAATSLVNLMVTASGTGITSQADIDRAFEKINNSMNGYLDSNPEVYEVLDNKGLLTFPTLDDVEVHKESFAAGEERTPRNLYAINLRNSGINNPLFNVDAVEHPVLEWGAGISYPGVDRIQAGSDAWGHLTRAYGNATGNMGPYTDYLLAEREAAMSRSSRTGSGSGSGTGPVTKTQERAATQSFVEGARAIDQQYPHQWQIMSDEDIANTGLEYMDDEGNWQNSGQTEAQWRNPETGENVTLYSPRHAAYLLDLDDPEILGYKTISSSNYYWDVGYEHEKALAGLGAPPPQYMGEIRDTFMSELKREDRGYVEGISDVWPKYEQSDLNDNLKISGEPIPFKVLQDGSHGRPPDPDTVQRLFADFSERYGMNILDNLHPGMSDDFTLEYFRRYIDSTIGRSDTLSYRDQRADWFDLRPGYFTILSY